MSFSHCLGSIVRRYRTFDCVDVANLKLLIYKDNKDRDTTVQFTKKIDDIAFCPSRAVKLFAEPDSCQGGKVRFRNYFPKNRTEISGGYEEVIIKGLYFEHTY